MGAVRQSDFLTSGLQEVSTKIALIGRPTTHSDKTLNHSNTMTPIQSAQPFGSLTDNTSRSVPNQNPSTRDTFVVLVTVTVISITLYFSYYLWKKNRHRSLSAASKLEEYRYSRLSQNEIDVDNVQFNDPLSPLDDSLGEPECHDEGLVPATLQLEMDALITISDEQNRSNLPITNGRSKPVDLIDDLSDEDLLQ